MPLFGRRNEKAVKKVNTNTDQHTASPSGYATAASLPPPNMDWTLRANIVAEWENQLEKPEQAILGWRNGSRLFEEGPIPAQTANVAEYISRGLAYHLFDPLLSDPDALVAARRILVMVDQVPGQPAFLAQFAPRISRLALCVIRDKGWQPMEYGGNGSVEAEVVNARTDGLVFYSARSPGIPVEDTWRHFFMS